MTPVSSSSVAVALCSDALSIAVLGEQARQEFGNNKIRFMEFPSPEAILARLANSNISSSVRVLDRFFLVESSREADAQKALRDEFFDWIASDYDSLIDRDRNLRNIRSLADELVKIAGSIRSGTVIDYGCGSGLSMTALPDIDILGVDSSESMRWRAKAQGLNAISPEEFADCADKSFLGCFASYSLHFPQDEGDYRTLWDKLAIEGALVANFHKGAGLQEAVDALTPLGAVIRELQSDSEHGARAAFIKPE